MASKQIDPSQTGAVSSRSTGFHQRKISLTTACPPTGRPDSKHHPSYANFLNQQLSANPLSPSSSYWYKRLYRWRIVRVIVWAYILLSVGLFTLHILSSIWPTESKVHQTSLSSQYSPSELNRVTPQLRISKMFSKSSTHMDHVRPFWFTATTQPKAEALTLTTVLTLDEWDQLKRLTEIWQGPISATLQLVSDNGLQSGTVLQQLARIRREYDASPSLQQYVDLHLVIRPDARHEEFPIFSTGGMQEARNLARLFSRSKYFVAMPVTTLWTTNLTNAVEEYKDILDEGDVLVVPTFAFPRRHNGMIETSWPKEREGIIEWVRAGRMGMLDYHWPMNRGPSSWPEWQEAEEAYLVTEYDFHYNPVYIATRDDHPWCEERFEDQLSACVYSMFLAGSDLFVLHDNFIVRTGQEPEDKLTETERAMQVAFYKNFRIEQCVFYARQFDQNGLFDTEIASHVKQECAKALGSLQKEKMIGKPHQH